MFGRSYFAVSYHGASVFPEDDDRNRALWIAVELSPAGALAPPEPLGDAVAEAILASLLRRSSELANYVPAARQRAAVAHALRRPARAQACWRTAG